MNVPLQILDFFKKRPKTLVFFITLLVYSPLLSNEYTGDDNIIIARNTFYHSWENIPRVIGIEKGSVADQKQMSFNSEPQADFGTGREEYRPISNLTFFLDYYLFGAKPYGSHLINILIHGANAVLVYGLVNYFFSSSILAIFTALLFSLHPIQSEAVAGMSFRADLLAAMFSLIAFYFWIKFYQGGYLSRKYYYGTLVMYFLAIFSKEAAFILPLVIILFDQILVSPRSNFRQRGIWYIGFVSIFLLFLYLYFVVFPSPVVLSISPNWLGGTFANHCLIIGHIWCNFLSNILVPWTVKVIPGRYQPPAPGLVSLETAEIVIFIILLITIICALWRRNKKCAFFLLWYIVFYLPLSNLIPIVNPMANRYMYLPSIGLLIVLAFFLHKLFKSTFIKDNSPYLSKILYVGVILICVTRTLFLSEDFKNSFYLGAAWVRDFPTDSEGYALLGNLYLDARQYHKAKTYLEESVVLGGRIPRDLFGLGECYLLLGEYQSAEVIFKQLIVDFPDYSDPLYCLGYIYYKQKNYQQAQEMLERSLITGPERTSAYDLLMKVYSNLHELKAANELLIKAGLYLNAQNVLELRNLIGIVRFK